jgi:hypothetical protein
LPDSASCSFSAARVEFGLGFGQFLLQALAVHVGEATTANCHCMPVELRLRLHVFVVGR